MQQQVGILIMGNLKINQLQLIDAIINLRRFCCSFCYFCFFVLQHTFSCSLNEHFRCLSSGRHGNRNCELFEIYKCNVIALLYASPPSHSHFILYSWHWFWSFVISPSKRHMLYVNVIIENSVHNSRKILTHTFKARLYEVRAKIATLAYT